MFKRSLLYLLIIIVILTAIFVNYSFKKDKNSFIDQETPVPNIAIEATATFKIITNGTIRIFTDKKYHNQSSNVYITSQNPELIYIKEEGIRWSDFFATLPMKLTKDCLTTGTGQVFCSNSEKQLKFYINNKENTGALDEIINNNDFLLVEYK